MNKYVGGIMLIFFLLTGCASVMQSDEGNRPQKPDGRMKPPPEAIVACKEKSEGTAVQFTTSRGDTLKGICKNVEGILTAMPERGAPPPQGGRYDGNSRGSRSDW